MFIYETTANDRLIIEGALDGVFTSLDRAHNLLDDVISGHFAGYVKQAVSAQDAELIADKLEIVGEVIFNALLAYSLTIGRRDFRGVAPYMESAERAALAIKVRQQLENTPHGTERVEIMHLPDKQVATILEKGGQKYDRQWRPKHEQ